MIRTESEYQEARRRLEQDRRVADAQREGLVGEGLTPGEVARGMEPLLSFRAQLEEEIMWYERVRAGDIPPVQRLEDIGRLLIALRIAHGLSQRELAERLGVSEAVISRDERNEYHAITVTRAQRIVEALRGTVTARVEEPQGAEEVPAPR